MLKMKRAMAITVVLLLLAGMTAISALAEGSDKIIVSLRIEGIEETIFYNKAIELSAGSTVEDLMAQANKMDENLAIVATGIEWGGTYISEIAGLAEFDYTAYSGWLFRVNGVNPTVGQEAVFLESGDEVIYFYNDAWGEAGMQYPVPDLSRLYSAGIITFMSDDEVFDEDWTVSFVRNPVAGATVTFNGAVYITDENGEIVLASKAGAAGIQNLKIERYDEGTGIPTVLRLAPDFEMYVPFVDTPEDAWYDMAVMFCVSKGLFIGTDAANNLFSPMADMTMAQLVTVLARLAGVNVDAGSADPWYALARDWAIQNGIIEDAAFEAGAFVNREVFANMFYLTAGLAGTYDMAVSADITEAVDFDDISEDCREAIAWAVASGIIHGTSDATLTISPKGVVDRATVCQMLYNYEAA